MTITPIALRIERFRSFRKEQIFSFPQKPGLYLMLGKNEVEPRLAGNGSGKTTIWDALTWCVHGKTASGLKAGDVCNWDEKGGTDVRFIFLDDDGAPWCMKRTWGPNSWTLLGGDGEIDEPAHKYDLAKDPQNPVLAALRLEFDAWLAAILMAQGEDYFLDMDRTKQANLFGSVMNLEEWDLRSERASAAASAMDKDVRVMESDLAHAQGRVTTLEDKSMKNDADAWEEKRKKRLDRLIADHDDLMRKRKGLREALDQAMAREKAAYKGLEAATLTEASKAAADHEYELVCANVRRHEDKLLKLKVETDAIRSHLDQLDKNTGACPVCGAVMDTKHWQQESKRAERVLAGAAAEAANLSNALDIIKKRRDVIECQIDQDQDKERAAQHEVSDAVSAVNRARQEYESLLRTLDKVEDMADEVEAERNPFHDVLDRMAEDLELWRDEVQHLSMLVDEGAAEQSRMQLWVKGFKEIRLREIASALAELEMEVNSAVMALGLAEWQLDFNVDRETKGGTIQRGFSVAVHAPGAGERAVPWEAWSGGEKQRLRIAGNAGLSDLVRARTGCDFPLEVWDEPTTGLSPEGKVDLFRYLADRAQAEERIIFLLDHQAHDFGGFAGTCTIIKTPSGSRIRASWGKDV